ncbi:hypothetical protein [Hymenobacter koreensis]|uniref:Lipoprotein n=1 Tax=Hymenobacter koreensis TaxID=1084523 RepID=A0ABP8J887_9BACT
MAAVLAACAGGTRPYAGEAPPLAVQLQAQSADAFNIVWLRATVTNTSTRAVWVEKYPDTVETACSSWRGLVVQGTTPKGDSLAICQHCIFKVKYRKPEKLAPGAQRTVNLQLDFNRLFPAAFIDSAEARGSLNCAKYFNRTTGIYRLQAVGYGYSKSRPTPQIPATKSLSNTVQITRK